jgi:hypothetical protein
MHTIRWRLLANNSPASGSGCYDYVSSLRMILLLGSIHPAGSDLLSIVPFVFVTLGELQVRRGVTRCRELRRFLCVLARIK